MKQVDFANGKIQQNVLQTALPMLAAQVLNLLYNIVDRIYIGRIPGEGTAALGGVGLCFPVIVMILAFTNLFGAGGAPLCSMALGEGNREKAERIMNTSFVLLLVSSVLLTILGLVFAKSVLYAFGASEVTIHYAYPYLRIYLFGTIASMIATGMNPFINAQGFSNVGMMSVFVGAAANIILDPIFMFGFGWGVQGAAFATVLSQFLSLGFVLRFLLGKKAELKLRASCFHTVKVKTVGNIASLGLVSFIMQFTNSLVSVVCNHMLSIFGGDIYISIYTIISSIRQMVETPVLAITDGSSPVLSFNYGAKKYGKLREAVRIVTFWAIFYTLVIWILISFFPGFFISIFSSDRSLLSAAIPLLHLYFFGFIFQSLQYSGQNVFKSLNKKRQAIFFSLFRKVIMVIPMTLILPRIESLGPKGVFLAEPISNLIGGIACFAAMYFTVYGKLEKN